MPIQYNTVMWGGMLRLVETVFEAAPTILCGLLVMGIFKRLLGDAMTCRLFGDGRWSALPRAWALGMLLPVCSLGVIPICRQMRSAGIAGGVILAFALSAPLFNPVSMIYGLTLSKPIAIFVFACCSFLVLTFVGGLWDRLFPGSGVAQHASARIPPGFKRMLAVAESVCREAAGPAMLFILAGILGVGILGVVLPFGSLQTSLNAGDPWAPWVMLGVGLPAYATPMTAMMQMGSMFHHGNSIGAAFVLLTIGAGTNLGLLAWVFFNYGAKRGTAWLLLIVTVVMSLAFLIESPLRDASVVNTAHVEDHPHTHAFDIYCQPFPPTTPVSTEHVRKKMDDAILPHEMICFAIVGTLVLAGGLIRTCWDEQAIEAWLVRVDDGPAGAADVWKRPLPAPVLGVVALGGLVVVSILGCYVYYPDPETALEDLRLAKIEVFSAAVSGDHDEAEAAIDWANDLTRRLEVGVYIRQFGLPEKCRQQTKLIRDLLEELDHAIEDNEPAERRRQLALQIDRACAECRSLYLPTVAAAD